MKLAREKQSLKQLEHYIAAFDYYIKTLLVLSAISAKGTKRMSKVKKKIKKVKIKITIVKKR